MSFQYDFVLIFFAKYWKKPSSIVYDFHLCPQNFIISYFIFS